MPVFDRFRSDHVQVLERIDALERAIGKGPRRAPDERSMREWVTLLEAQFATHMRDEEEILYPALAESVPETAAGLAGLGAEHRELRQMLASLRATLDRDPGPARDEQIVVQLGDFIDLLRIHVRKEEASIFTIAARVLDSAEILALSRRLAERQAARADSPSWRPLS